MQVPMYWVVASFIYFCISIIWSAGLIAGMFMLYKKTMPVLEEARIQVRRVSNQAKSVAAKASNTADIVHAQTQHFIGNANSAGGMVTKQARTVGAALTALLVGARVVSFVRKML